MITKKFFFKKKDVFFYYVSNWYKFISNEKDNNIWSTLKKSKLRVSNIEILIIDKPKPIIDCIKVKKKLYNYNYF